VRNDVTAYRTWVFDCDGVLLDSNSLKTEAFRLEAERFGSGAADELVRYHQAHGGISRQVKSRYFFEEILGRAAIDDEIDEFLRGFAARVRNGLASVPADEALVPLLVELGRHECRLFVVSGGDEDEVRNELDARDLSGHFAGVYGSPSSKPTIIAQIERDGLLERPAVLVGDSRLDAECAERFDLEFVFVEHWSEWERWRQEVPAETNVIHDLAELVALLRSTRS
jgi:phosphoglycolate phosphatase-like HAD superfamily hydrolase